MDFTAFSHAMGNWWGNPCISHIIKYTIECESTGKKALILWEKYEYQFPSFSTYNGFCRKFPGTNFQDFPPFECFGCLFPCYGKLMRKHMHFPCDEVYHKMGIYWKNASIIWEKYEPQYPWFSILQWFLLHFPVLWEIDGETHAFPIWWSTS